MFKRYVILQWPKSKQERKNFFLFFWLQDCGCSATGSVDRKCQRNGKCECKPNFRGDKCEECQKGFYGYPECKGSDFLFSFLSNSKKL